MAVCTKFKIATWFSSISPRIQSYSSVQKDGGIRKNRLRNKRMIKNAQIIDKANECSRSAFHKDCFASGASAKYMEYLFYKWVKNVNSVHKSWNYYFNDLVGTKKIVSKPKTPNEFKVVLDDLPQAHASSDPEPIAEMQKWIQQSNLQSNRQPTTNMSSNGPNSLPPLTPEQPTIVGHINLSPFKDAPSAPKSIKDLMEHQQKSKSSVMKKTQHFPNMKEVKTAIQRKRISAGQNEMAKQSKKTDSSGGILTKKSSEPTRK